MYIRISTFLSQALIHVSTAYCNCDRSEISEVVYTTPYHPDDIISLINWLPEDMLDKVSVREYSYFSR